MWAQQPSELAPNHSPPQGTAKTIVGGVHHCAVGVFKVGGDVFCVEFLTNQTFEYIVNQSNIFNATFLLNTNNQTFFLRSCDAHNQLILVSQGCPNGIEEESGHGTIVKHERHGLVSRRREAKGVVLRRVSDEKEKFWDCKETLRACDRIRNVRRLSFGFFWQKLSGYMLLEGR